MKVSDVIHGRIAAVELRRADGGFFTEGMVPQSEAFLFETAGGVRQLQIAENAWQIVAAAPRDEDILRQLLAGNLPRLSWLVQAVPARTPAERVLVQCHEFVSMFAWNETTKIGVDEMIVDDMRKRRRRLVSVESVVQWLTQTMLLPPRTNGESPRVLLSGSPAPKQGKKSAFRLYGAGFAVDVQSAADGGLRVTRVVEKRLAVASDERQPICLATWPIGFCDATLVGQFRGIAQTELDHLVAQTDSYLALWKQYNERERHAILSRARDFGWLPYKKAEELPDGTWRFYLQGNRDQADDWEHRLNALDGEQLQAGEEVPAAIQAVDSDPSVRGLRKQFVGDVVKLQTSPPALEIRQPHDQDDRVPPERGYLFICLTGDETRIARRRDAWERIRSGGRMPQLGLIIEGRPVPERPSRGLKPVTKAVRDVFPNLNDRQMLALDVALNTPDIALIQGPPGTGKTRLLAALQARLAEKDEGADPDGLSGNTLLTSFQHDAVENAAAATRVMGLPAVKVGYRRGADEIRDGVEIWRTETAQTVRASRAESSLVSTVHAALQAVRKLAVAYIQAPRATEDPADLLRRVSELARPWLPTTLVTELGKLWAHVSSPASSRLEDEDRAFVMNAIRGLRTEAGSFSDDGPSCAQKVLARLARLDAFDITSQEKTVLEDAATSPDDSAASEELLARLKTVRDSLLDRLQPPADASRGPRVHADVEDMLVRVVDSMVDCAKETAPGVDAVIQEWLTALENDPEGVREAVRHYSMVLAATCQQSVSKAMAEAKLGDDTVFRTVIVDEAARSNPLDLFIPMALAERRVVLVGDHRQLPHILEPDIERELEQSVRDATRSALGRSLFEKLFTELRQRETRDGVRRTVTLNVQYRMHPVLGEFISEQFYAPYHEGFTSGRPAEDFTHAVTMADGRSLAGTVAAWIDVPRDRGLESPGRSKKRSVEAACVAKEVQAVVVRHPELSVGVITFYAAQLDEILAEMARAGIDLTEPDETGGHRVRDRWRTTTDGRERLRIGTVDSFQGKEFDIVFLSPARSNRIHVVDEVTRKRRYGFLLLANRLCVAMSRQHRLLVVVGDMEMVTGPDAEMSVPGMNAFKKLCEGPHGRIVRT